MAWWNVAEGREVAHVRGDAGSGTVWMVAVIGLIASVGAMAMAVGGARVARHRAYAAADLAALAAAGHSGDGVVAACRVADRVARGSGGRLRRCAVDDGIADVVVTTGVRTPVGRLTATARARAGPPEMEASPVR